MIKKMMAAISAATIACTCSAYCAGSYIPSASYAAEQSAQQTESCGVTVSVIAPNDTLPAGITVRLVAVRGGERTDITEWDPKAVPVKEIAGLEFSDDVSYKLVTENVPDDFFLPEETDIVLNQKGDVDKIVLCGFNIYKNFGFFTGITEGDEMHFCRFVADIGPDSSGLSGAYEKDIIEEACIVDDNGFRYVNAVSDSRSGFFVPDGHYTAFVKPAEGYRFIDQYSEAASFAAYMKYNDRDYYGQDFSKGIEFDVKYGYTDTPLTFIVEKLPSAEDSCSADISVIDEDTGELIGGCILELENYHTTHNENIIWKTSADEPMSFDSLRSFGSDYTVTVKYIPGAYKAEKEYTFSFDEFGQHEELIIKAKRTMTAEEEAALTKVELPDEAPVPVDAEHCAVTIGVFDLKTRAVINDHNASIIELVNGNRDQKVELVTWDVSEEPVKSITDIEFHEGSDYYLIFNDDNFFSSSYNNSNRVKLYLNKGGDTEKIAVPMYKDVYRTVSPQCFICRSDNEGALYSSVMAQQGEEYPFEYGGIFDDKGYRYSYNSVLTYGFDPFGVGALPDGEYTMKAIPKEGYRFITPSSETAGIEVLRDKVSAAAIAANEELGKNGLRFKVEGGIADRETKLYIEAAPSETTSCSADIHVVDDATGEPVKGVALELTGYNVDDHMLRWNTTDCPVMSFDNLRCLGKKYKVRITFAPEGYEYESSVTEISFDEFGQHNDVVIKLSKAFTSDTSGTLGDVNSDGMIDSVDASAVLAHYAKISTDQEGEFTESQKILADVDKNGIIDSVDASNILAYYAYVSTADEDLKTMEEFMAGE